MPDEKEDSLHARMVRELGERDPDHRPSDRPIRTIDHGKQLHFVIDVGFGGQAMEMVVEGDPKTGRLIYKGMKLCRVK